MTENVLPPEPPAAARPAGKITSSEWIAALYAIVLLIVFIATLQLYFTIQDVIRTWFSDQFVPLVSGIYYIAIIATGLWLFREYLRR